MKDIILIIILLILGVTFLTIGIVGLLDNQAPVYIRSMFAKDLVSHDII